MHEVPTFDEEVHIKDECRSSNMDLVDFGLGSELKLSQYYQHEHDQNVNVDNLLAQAMVPRADVEYEDAEPK